MTTTEINANRLDTIRGSAATALVTVSRNHLRRRMIAIGAGTGRGFVITTGGAATVQAPADFAEAVAEVDSRSMAQWTTVRHDAVDGEAVGEEFSRTPFLY